MEVFKNLLIPGKHDKPIVTDVFYDRDGQPKPVVILLHGFKGFKDWGHFNQLAEIFAQRGFVFVKFNFAYNGTTVDEPDEFANLDAFGNNNLTKELDDVQSVINYVLAVESWKAEIDKEQLYLIGHSRGGGIAIISAAEDERIKKVVTWASVGEYGQYWNDEAFVKQWKQTGVIYVDNSRTNQQMPMYYQYYEDFKNNIERLSIENAVKRLTIPLLAIHGTADAVVPYYWAEQLHQWNVAIDILPIENADHTFGIKHPHLPSTFNKDAQKAVEETMLFLKI